MGKPSWLNPQGTEIVGIPYASNGEVFLKEEAMASGGFWPSSIVAGSRGDVGVMSKSTSEKTVSISR